ncbi:pentatricopeptide repeat-containing protein At5g67570, chloroplastic isoform X2 [Brachypodium distachyon]|uniref:PROP1-like PPR domain-containing protein n=2 Tax=Brachypodium distachyon TaxID=15368 RepID=I1GQP8_BRADI|nr:pentatricopeptide repeat-containing protein At5g67570, chloroplastic isoform X2 [Brachypodium distachyon]KQK14386.1 hypothetical protein BRADI_1g15900v3 [Brachypodium distachyon]|eukprot:XP_003562366.1 pentatricopeptide repeat-containing protein At5g67570, chloroplastic isoform X2 [Brachypodium distachyon]
MAISSPSPRFHLSLHLQNPNPSPNQKPRQTPSTETLRRRLLRKGVSPTPKILHTLRKKEAHKSLRRARKDTSTANAPPTTEDSLVAQEEARFRAAAEEYRVLMGRPWDGASSASGPPRGTTGNEGLGGLREMLEARRSDGVRWLLEDDVEKGEADDANRKQRRVGSGWISEVGDEERRIELLVSRLSEGDLSLGDWRLSRMMKQADLIYNEDNLLQILKRLETQGNWRQAVAVTEWVYNENTYKHRRSRFVYTKLLSILGKSLVPTEALRVFKIMLGDAQIYPDMAAYHSIAVTLGRAGLLNELIKIIDYMRQKPSKRVMRMRRKDWDPLLEPDLIIYNSVLNACVLSQQWKGVFWVFKKMRFGGLTPTGATFGLAMEVMLKAKKYDFVQKFFEKMQRKGVPPRAITYKVLVRAFWEQGKVNEAVEAVEDMEQRGIVGAASVYYELACCLCNKGKWKEAMLQVEKLEQLRLTKPLEYVFTGMILASFDGGYMSECISIFESMKDYCAPNIGTINVMLKVYGRSDMFVKAKDLFETTTCSFSSSQPYICDHSTLQADAYTYSSMLEASAHAQQWEYFENAYRRMILSHHHLDQSKYSWLLIKASRAGKPYLLEHALNSILDRGETPDVQLFTENVCQTIAHSDYGRTLCLLNFMSAASVDVNELQWSDLLQQNMFRFSVNALKDLLMHLSTGDTIERDPALSFVRALQSQYATFVEKDTSFLADCGDTEALLLDKFSNSNLMEQDLSCNNSLDTSIFPEEKGSNEFSDCSTNIPEVCPLPSLGGDIVLCGSHLGNKENLGHWSTKVSAIEEVLDCMNPYGNNTSYEEMPAAAEILELWEQESLNDIFGRKNESTATMRG